MSPKKEKWFFRLFNAISSILDFIYAFLEMHLVKIVSFSIMALCCSMVNAFHFIVVIMLLLSLIFGISALRFSFSLLGPFLSILFLSKMVYQTKFIPKFDLIQNCSIRNLKTEVIIRNTVFDPEWWGFQFLKRGETMLILYTDYTLVFLVMTLQAIIRARQKLARIDSGQSPEIPPVLFPNITRKDADINFRNCLKYLINYGFYKFGIEITLCYCVFAIIFRMDVFSVVYAFWVAILTLPRRRAVAVLWPFFFTCVILSILWQYSMALGLSTKSCYEYPWANKVPLLLWLFLPSFQHPPNTNKILVDFVLVLLIKMQLRVFQVERKYGESYLGGSNKEVYMHYYDRDFVSTVPDHTGSIRSWIEVAKFLFMTCLFRITLAFVFWNGASNANLLSLGYLVGAFVFLWIDYDLCLWHIKRILKWWNILLGYTVFVILFKSILEFAGCIFGDYLGGNAAWLVELLSLRCSSLCNARVNLLYQRSPSLYWDLVCFCLAIFQRRYFQSNYFVREVDDVLGVFRLQAKGAKLIDQLQEYQLKEFQVREKKTLAKIKKNMNRIKAWQKGMHGLNYKEPTDHATAIYMGDYIMFDDLVEDSSYLDDSSSDDETEEDGETKPQKKIKSQKKELTMSEFIGTVLKRAGEEALSKRRDSGPQSSRPRPENYDKENKEERESQDDDIMKKKTRQKGLKQVGSISKESSSSEEEEKKTAPMIRIFLDSVMVSMIRFFNKYSRDYRYIESIMKIERRIQKQKFASGSSTLPSRQEGRSTPRIELDLSSDFKGFSKNFSDSRDDFTDDSFKKSSQALLVNLINSVCIFVMSKTELFCYIIIFLHTLLSPTLIAVPLPLFVFFWGSLTTVRPTTTFWTVLIAYTEVTVVIKALFQNSIFPWNIETAVTSAEYPPLFLGIHRDNQYVIADLFLLLLLFLHRYKLKTLGLWNRTHEEETIPPQNLKIYKELPSESDFKDIKGNRSLVLQRQRLLTELTDVNDSIGHFFHMATWKCTSRATAKILYWGNNMRTKIKVKEIEGPILVTHDGRRLEPTGVFVPQTPDEVLEGNIVLRVYINDTFVDTRSLIYRLSWVQHFSSIRKFFTQLAVRDWRVSADFYTLMFFFEFLDFLIVFFGYPSFTESVEITTEDFSLADSQVPIMYLVTIIAHFLIIIVDRILYLRKNVVGKLILQFLLVILLHIWMFIVIPILTEGPFNRLLIPQTYYMISCLYFLMSAYQLRVGYPLRVQGHFLTRKYGYLNFYAYKGLQLIPFFNQLRTILDFLCTPSSLSMMQWIKMESMFQLVYENKCSRREDINYPVPRGQECRKCPKYAPGIFVLLGMIIIIWLPFLVFALFSTVSEPNLPQEASLELQIGNFAKIFVTTATFTDILKFTESQYAVLQSLFKDSRRAWSFLSLYDYKDVGVLKFRFEPFKQWAITPQELSLLNATVQNLDIPISMHLTWFVQRIPRSQIVAHSKGHLEIILNKNDTPRHQLAQAFLNNSSNKIRLNHILPKFIHVTNEGEAKPLPGFLSGNGRLFRNVILSLHEEDSIKWWKFEELADDKKEKEKISKIPLQNKKEITIYTFNDKNIPKLLLNVSKRGIIGLYLSIVFVSWTFVKRLMWKYPYLMFDEMPNPDHVLKLCYDIYLARESHEFALEEDLYAKLLFLFRSPETMIKVTRLNTSN